jgi:2-iminoacetate synthase ThiH
MERVNTLQDIADRVAGGHALTDDEAAALFGAHDLITIGMMADGVRRQMHGTDATFVRVFAVHVDAVPSAAPPGIEAGEVRLVGRPASLDEACVATASARRWAGEVLSGFSLTDVAAWMATDPAACRRLRDSGLDAVAEVPLDDLDGLESAVSAAGAAGLATARLTVQQVPEDPVVVIRRAVELQQATGVCRAFAPLPRTLSAAEPTTGYDDVRCIAVARLMARNIRSIQVDWPLYGPKLAQVALTVGADDVDGVAAQETGALGGRRSAIEEIRRNIRAAGLEPVERNGLFERMAAGRINP